MLEILLNKLGFTSLVQGVYNLNTLCVKLLPSGNVLILDDGDVAYNGDRSGAIEQINIIFDL
jgi:hypothetical protein